MAEGFYRFGELVVPTLVKMNGTKFTFRGLENIPERGGALLAQNHTSYLDWLPSLFAARERGRRMYFMIKAEMADVKAVDYVIKHARLIAVDRRTGHDALELAVQRLRAGELIGMHPEATISRSFELREFKTGAARMALAAQVPVVPLIVWGAHRIWPKDHPKKLLRNKIPITVAAAPPLPPHGTPGQLNAALREAMNAVLYGVQEEYPHPKGEYWVPQRLGGSAPDQENSRAMRLAELQERIQKHGSDGVTRLGQTQSGKH
jgi:1-acyl-sn-glycerol-3-phosphate acyltransferase